MRRTDQHIYIEWRGGTCRVKWWSGETLPSGRKRYESKAGFTDEDEAIRHGQDQLYEIRHGLHVSNRDGATLMSEWLDDWAASLNHTHTTERRYKSNIKTHIKPYFGDRTVGEIDVIDCRGFRKHLERTLSPNSVAGIIMVLGMVFEDAVPHLRKSSPVERRRKRGKFVKKTRERKRDVLPEAIEALARNAQVMLGYSGYVFVWTMAVTGMRPAELYGLTREYSYPTWPASDLRPDPAEEVRYDEDLERYGQGEKLMPAVRVERQVQHKDGRLQFFPPKYGSARTLVIPPFLAEMLEKLLAGHGSKWVFPGPGGGSLGSVNFNSYYWRSIADGAPARKGPKVRKPRPALPKVPAFEGKRLYLIRHAHKAWMDEDGHSRFAVESRMGHEVQGVEGVYSSVTEAMERDIMKTLQKRWELLQGRPDGE
jgi:integrase